MDTQSWHKDQGMYMGNGHCLPYISPYVCIYTDLEEGMATHSSTLTWRIPWTEKPGGLQFMWLQRIGHDWATKHRTAYTHIYFQIYIYIYIYTYIFKIFVCVYTTTHTCASVKKWNILFTIPQPIYSLANSKEQIIVQFNRYNTNLFINQFSSVAQSYLTLCDPMDCNMPGFPVHHQLLEFTQTHVHRVGDAIQPSHPLLSPSPPAFSLFQHQSLSQWISSSHQVAKVLELQLQHQSFQWIFRTELL